MAIYLIDDVYSVKAKRFNKMFTSILVLFFLLRILAFSSFNHFLDALFVTLLAGNEIIRVWRSNHVADHDL